MGGGCSHPGCTNMASGDGSLQLPWKLDGVVLYRRKIADAGRTRIGFLDFPGKQWLRRPVLSYRCSRSLDADWVAAICRRPASLSKDPAPGRRLAPRLRPTRLD